MKLDFSHFTPQVRLFFVEKRKPRIFGFKNVVKRAIRKIFTSAIRQMHLNFLGKKYRNPYNFEETPVPLQVICDVTAGAWGKKF